MNKIRLPIHVKPSHYQITMRPNLDNFTFTGKEVIKLEVSKKSKQLVLHAADLKIHYAAWQQGKTIVEAQKIKFQPKDETVTFIFAQSLSGKGNLIVEFEGELNDSLRGFYRSSYTHKGQQKHLATTQFEATDARRAFPSFDEPAQKATFKVSLIVPENLTAISNTLEDEVAAHEPGYKIVHFATSPKMSTYLLAFLVGEFESVEGKTKSGTKVRVFTTPGKTKHAKFALEVGKRSLEFLEKYFTIRYPLPVLDLIAIPDFAAGAMENWGAVTFRETALLIDEKNSPFINRERVAEVIAHELVHQWFGNLVTMEWWTHLWLNESFATYMAYKTIDELFPEWHIMTKFVLNEYNQALHLDSLQNTHPIEVPVHHPSEIGQIFDAISYSKGASILRMLENYIGSDNFRNGLRLYLQKHSYKNTSSIHLWEAFEKASGKPVSKLMNTWTTKPGYPVITAAAKNTQLSLKQERFQLLPTPDKTKWPVPVQAGLAKDKVSKIFELNNAAGNFPVPENNEFIKLNLGHYGFYRSAYAPALMAQILVAARNKDLSVIDRLGLVSDIFALAKSGHTASDLFLEAVQYLAPEEDSYVVWSNIASDLAELHLLLNKELAEQLAKFVEPFFTQLVKQLGWETKPKETTAQSLLRAVAIRSSGYYGNKAVIKKAQQLFTGHLKGKTIMPDLRLAVYSTVARYGTARDWQNFARSYAAAEMQEERNRLGYAMTMFTNPKLIKQNIDFIFSDQVRNQDKPMLIGLALQNPVMSQALWLEIQQRWDYILENFSRGNLLGHIIAGLGHFKTEKELRSVKQFFKTHRHTGGEQRVKQALESITINTGWLKRDRTVIKQYLKQAKN